MFSTQVSSKMHSFIVTACDVISSLYSETDIVLSAPTGSGKTLVFELAIVELLMRVENAGIDKMDVKIIYGKKKFALILLRSHQIKFHFV